VEEVVAEPVDVQHGTLTVVTADQSGDRCPVGGHPEVEAA